MDTYILSFVLRCIAMLVVGVFMLLIVIAGNMAWKRLKRKWTVRNFKRATLNSSKILAQKQVAHKIQEWILVGEYAVFVHQLTE